MAKGGGMKRESGGGERGVVGGEGALGQRFNRGFERLAFQRVARELLPL